MKNFNFTYTEINALLSRTRVLVALLLSSSWFRGTVTQGFWGVWLILTVDTNWNWSPSSWPKVYTDSKEHYHSNQPQLSIIFMIFSSFYLCHRFLSRATRNVSRYKKSSLSILRCFLESCTHNRFLYCVLAIWSEKTIQLNVKIMTSFE